MPRKANLRSRGHRGDQEYGRGSRVRWWLNGAHPLRVAALWAQARGLRFSLSNSLTSPSAHAPTGR